MTAVLEPERLRLDGAGVALAADAYGPDDGARVLLLHGGGQTRRSWRGAAAGLGADGLRAVALDLRGHGDSGWSPDAQYGPEAHAADVVALVPQLGAPLVLVGASLGGLASLLAAAELGPEVVRGLVLVDIVPRIRRQGAERVVAFMRGAPDGFASLEEAADAVASYLPHRSRPRTTDGLRTNLRQRQDGRWVWHWDPRMLQDPDAGKRLRGLAALESAAEELRVPVVLVRGLQSDVVDDDGVARLRAQVPGLQVVDLEKAAHTAATDDNAGFASAVVDFVRTL
ncbi:MAG: alpha/beta hydrolase [Frankiales bacterium]|nr:alpha/beta hydrolase [Frankiales bacterium]